MLFSPHDAHGDVLQHHHCGLLTIHHFADFGVHFFRGRSLFVTDLSQCYTMAECAEIGVLGQV